MQGGQAARDGAVAAPTAALHFTPGLIAALADGGIASETLTLHVGAGTFLPVKAEDTAEHAMHAEWGRIDAATTIPLVEPTLIVPTGVGTDTLLPPLGAWYFDAASWAARARTIATPAPRSPSCCPAS